MDLGGQLYLLKVSNTNLFRISFWIRKYYILFQRYLVYRISYHPEGRKLDTCLDKAWHLALTVGTSLWQWAWIHRLSLETIWDQTRDMDGKKKDESKDHCGKTYWKSNWRWTRECRINSRHEQKGRKYCITEMSSRVSNVRNIILIEHSPTNMQC